ncbi:protein kinase domain-containing protein [Acinetobacter sp. MB5]|uniref:protein kinase domain-containing protein n=1 Tax=Acinetobacter sp. MB5 TaxID=2069438 RepID=UPI000DD07C69|nr:protein kinase [Acinetobacter sp. MB5]
MIQFECPYQFQDKTPAQSRAFGRSIYLLEQAGQYYWLKLQCADGNAQFQQGFLSEIDFYRQLQNVQPTFLLSSQYYPELNVPELTQSAQALVLPHVPKLFISPNQLSFSQVIQRIDRALKQLDVLHTLGYVHGDIKASHFRYADDQVFLIDFEQTQPIHFSSSVLNATPRYMAPELFHAQKKTIQTDLYAFGIVLFEWLTQTRLSSKSYLDWAIFHCQTSVLDLPEHWKALQTCLNGLLARDYQHRFMSAKQASLCLKTINMY